MKSKRLGILACAVAALAIAGSAAAGPILVTTLPQGPGGLWNLGDTIGQAFTTGSAVTIGTATFRHDYGGYTPTAGATLTINSANGSGQIGGVLATWTAFTSDNTWVTFSGNYTLDPNTTYWIVLHDTGSQVARISANSTYTANFGASLPTTYDNYESSTNTYYSLSESPLSFEVTTVPDGGTTLALLGGALMGLGILRRRFRG